MDDIQSIARRQIARLEKALDAIEYVPEKTVIVVPKDCDIATNDAEWKPIKVVYDGDIPPTVLLPPGDNALLLSLSSELMNCIAVLNDMEKTSG